MMTSSSELPWVPVTIAEALDWREREIVEREASWQKQSGSAGKAEAERDVAKMRADEARVHANDQRGGLP